MDRTDERILNGELVLYLRTTGLPLPLAIWTKWVTRAVCWKCDHTVGAGAMQAYEALVNWIDHGMDGQLLRTEERRGTIAVQAGVIMGGRAQGVRVPKLVLVTVSIEPAGGSQMRATIDIATKVGRLSTPSSRRRATSVCQAVAEEIVQQLSALSTGKD